MSLQQKIRSAFRVMNFVTSERVWKAFSAKADLEIKNNLPDEKILIVAPHPDDDIFGCAGALSSVKKGQKVQVAYIFSGDFKGKSERVSAREEEAKEAVRLMTNPEQIFFRQSDNSVPSKKCLLELSDLLVEFGSGIIFMPSPTDPNIDHRQAVETLIRALNLARDKGLKIKDISVWLYEIWSPLPFFNRLIGFDWAKKEQAMEKFKSQNKERDYISAMRSLADYRMALNGLDKPQETFFCLPASVILDLEKGSNE